MNKTNTTQLTENEMEELKAETKASLVQMNKLFNKRQTELKQAFKQSVGSMADKVDNTFYFALIMTIVPEWLWSFLMDKIAGNLLDDSKRLE